MNREEHLQWCKNRALEYVEMGDMEQAFNSMISDLKKHEETKNHSAIALMSMLFMTGHLESCEEMGKFIKGFN